MAYLPSKGVKVSALLLVPSASAALILFVLLPSLTPFSSRPSSSPDIAVVGGRRDRRMPEQILPTSDDIKWLLSQIHGNSLPDPSNTPQSWHSLRKGINPRTRQQQLDDLLSAKGNRIGLVHWLQEVAFWIIELDAYQPYREREVLSGLHLCKFWIRERDLRELLWWRGSNFLTLVTLILSK